MNKFLIATTFSMFSFTSFAATQGTLQLQGTIGQVLSLSVQAVSSVNTSLDLTTTQTDLKVADVTEQSNSNTGYKILAKTTNGGLLKNGSLDQVSYSMKYDGVAVTLAQTDTAVKSISTGGVYSASSDVEISYTGQSAASLTQGTYSDTVTFTIQAN